MHAPAVLAVLREAVGEKEFRDTAAQSRTSTARYSNRTNELHQRALRHGADDRADRLAAAEQRQRGQ